MNNPNVALVTIGTEILIGQILDTNKQWLCTELNKIGANVSTAISISDKKGDIIDTLDWLLPKHDVVIFTGGLGPTKDDITKYTLSEYFDDILIENPTVLEMVKAYFHQRGRTPSELNLTQAMVPSKCEVMLNHCGTAPGMIFNANGKLVFSMPGVPFEMKEMTLNGVLPHIEKSFQMPEIYHHTILTVGIGESSIAEMIEDWENKLPASISLAYLPSPGKVRLRLSMIANKLNQQDREIFEIKCQELTQLVNKFYFGINTDTLEQNIGLWLKEKKLTLSTAESCTGGYLAHKITSIPGSSHYFQGSCVAYANDIKTNILGVSENTLQEFGAVSENTVKQMAEGALKKFDTDFSLSTSGIAGPDGGTEEKPVGTVWIALAEKNKPTQTQLLQLSNKRDLNIELTANACLNLLRKRLLFQ